MLLEKVALLVHDLRHVVSDQRQVARFVARGDLLHQALSNFEELGVLDSTEMRGALRVVDHFLPGAGVEELREFEGLRASLEVSA